MTNYQVSGRGKTIPMMVVFALIVITMSSEVQSDEFVSEKDNTRSGEHLINTNFDYEYIAIGPTEFRSVIEPLIQWKTSKGVKARYFDLDGEDNILTWNGSDTQEKVRNFIKHIYNNSVLEEGPGGTTGKPVLKWVLLVGDGEIIPTRRIFVNGEYSPEDDVPENFVNTDMYYAGLARSWDDNGNGIFGEEGTSIDDETDWEADVYVGRFPASDEKELGIMVSRQLNYERNPPPGDWTSSMLLTGSAMDAPNSVTYWDPYKDNANELVRRIEGNLPDSVTPFDLVDYPRQEFGGYNQMFDTLNRSSFRSYYEMGFSTAVLACHGDENGNCTEYKGDSGGIERWYYDMGVYFDYDMAESINNSFRTPLVYISNCDSLNFSEKDDTNMERLMRNPNGGAIGLIGASVTTYRGEYPEGLFEKDSFGNWWLAEEFFRILYNETPRPGEALYKQKFNHWVHIFDGYSPYPVELRMFRIDNLAYNLLGDPEGQIWLSEPKEMEIETDNPFYLSNGSMIVTVRDKMSGKPLPNATVTISSEDRISFYHSNRTDPRGKVFIPQNLTEPGVLEIVVTCSGFLPAEEEIKVISVSNLAISEDIVLNPKYPTAGETFEAELTLHNSGLTDLYGIKVEFTLEAMDQSGSSPRTNVRTVERLTSGDSVNLKFRTDSFFGRNRITVASIVPGVVESADEDNSRSMVFMTNDPMDKPEDRKVQLPEDTPLSEHTGLIDLSSFVLDDGYPRENEAEVWEVHGGFDVIERDMMVDVDPNKDWYGEGWFTVNITDSALSTTLRIDVNITPIPDPPVFIDPPRRVEAKEDEVAYMEITLRDPDSEALFITADLPAFEAREVEGDWHRFNISFIPDESMVGESFVNITASDSGGNIKNHSISIGVNSTNDPPEIETEREVFNTSAGQKVDIDLTIWDPDSKQEFRIFVESSLFSSFWVENSTTISFTVPEGIENGDYPLKITVYDEMNASRSLTLTVSVDSGNGGSFNILVVILVAITLFILILYGVFINLQEKKQENILKDVGTESPLEARTLSEEDFQGIPKSKTLQMPPIPKDTEGELAREEQKQKSEDEEIEIIPEEDIESDIDDVISEMFPNR